MAEAPASAVVDHWITRSQTRVERRPRWAPASIDDAKYGRNMRTATSTRLLSIGTVIMGTRDFRSCRPMSRCAAAATRQSNSRTLPLSTWSSERILLLQAGGVRHGRARADGARHG